MSQTILITGASGFVGTHVINAFLQCGYNVRGTVRSEKSAEEVKKMHPKHPSQLTMAIIPNIEAAGAFDDAVRGVDGVGRHGRLYLSADH